MPSTVNNPTDGPQGDDDLPHWEQTFRQARPTLSELSLARIETAIQREVRKSLIPQPRSRLRRRILFLLAILVLVNVAVVAVIMHWRTHATPPRRERPSVASSQDQYPMDVTVGPALVAPDGPILRESDFETGSQAVPARTMREELHQAASRWTAMHSDAWTQLGFLEMQRAAGRPLSAEMPADRENAEAYDLDLAWRLLPTHTTDPAFARTVAALQQLALDEDGKYWVAVFQQFSAAHKASNALSSPPATSPSRFPSQAGDQARFDLLVALGETKAQAALDVLTTRSYAPLAVLERLPADGNRRSDYLSAAHDAAERYFALRHAGRPAEADEFKAQALRLKYLTNASDMAVLLARLGPDAAWEQLLQPIMRDEAEFVLHPPDFDRPAAHGHAPLTILYTSKSEKAGVVNYSAVTLTAGPWRMQCNAVSVYHGSEQGVFLTGQGRVTVHGVLGLFEATADELTFSTHTGVLKLTGHVHLDQWTQSRDTDSCTITHTGTIR